MPCVSRPICVWLIKPFAPPLPRPIGRMRSARGRALMESGTLGGDVERLADRMIDALLHSDDSPA
jgi:hypothetical protein